MGHRQGKTLAMLAGPHLPLSHQLEAPELEMKDVLLLVTREMQEKEIK